MKTFYFYFYFLIIFVMSAGVANYGFSVTISEREECKFKDLEVRLIHAKTNFVFCNSFELVDHEPFFEELLIDILNKKRSIDESFYQVRYEGEFYVRNSHSDQGFSGNRLVQVLLLYTQDEFKDRVHRLKRHQLAELYWYLKIKLLFPSQEVFQECQTGKVPSLIELTWKKIDEELAACPLALIKTRMPGEEEFPRTTDLETLKREIIRLTDQFLQKKI